LYVEGGKPASVQPDGTHPPMVNVMAFGKQETEIAKVLKAVSESLSESLGLEGNVFVTYTELKAGRVMSGGKVLE